MRSRFLSASLLVAAGVALLAQPALARVKLITLPVRERVEVQLDHPSATLVEEERIVPLVRGTNQVDFSWANTRIDPHTIVFRVVGAEGEGNGDVTINVLSVSYPPGENALVWDISASASTAARVRISYLLGGLDKTFNYRAVAENDEKTLTLRQYVRVKNFANEAYDDTEIQIGIGDAFKKPIGLNETKEMLVAATPNVPIRKAYTCNPNEYGYIDRPKDKLRVPMHYVLRNDSEHKLGSDALPFGKVRIFQKDSQGTTAFLGEDWGQFTPVGDKMKLYLGTAQDVVVKRTIDDVVAEHVTGNLYHYTVRLKYEIENFKDQPVTLDVVEDIRPVKQEVRNFQNRKNGPKINPGRPSDWIVGGGTTLGKPDKEDSSQERTVFHVDLPARKGDKAEKLTHFVEIVYRNEF